MLWDEDSYYFNKLLAGIVEYMFIIFGPVLLVLCCVGLAQLHSYDETCEYDLPGQQINLVDVFILMCCTTMAVVITWVFAMNKTEQMAAEQLTSEKSVLYRHF